MNNEPCILVVDDEADLRNIVQTALNKEGFTNVITAATVAEGIAAFKEYSPQIAILDIMLPDGEGFDICKKIRETSTIPILFLSAKSDEIDKIIGLAIGGDDYITKPFSPKEVAYRVKAQLRRMGYSATVETTTISPTTKVGPFEMNADETEIYINDKLLELTAKEVGIMACFLRNPNRILSKELLYEHVWGEDFYGADNTLMVHIRRLREKVEDNPSTPKYITTVKGLGYKLVVK